MRGRWALRATTDADADVCYAIYTDGRAHEVVGWPADIAGPFLEMQYKARSLGYDSRYPGLVDQIVVVGGEPVGRLLTGAEGDGLRLVDITLLARVRGQGLGTLILRSLMTERPVRLNVARGNRAAALYRRLGFERVGGDDVYDAMEWRPDAPRA